MTLALTEALADRQSYTLTVEQISDCKGNTGNSTFEPILKSLSAEAGDIIINEVLFNPPTNGVDFVEIYNKSDKPIDVHQWRLAQYDSDTIKSYSKPIASHPLQLLPKQYLALTEDTLILQRQHPTRKHDRFHQCDLVSLNDDDGDFALLFADSTPVERFAYDEDMHFELLEDIEGITLERIGFDAPVQTADSWKSAAKSVGYATPSYLNSQHVDNPIGQQEGCFSITPQIITPNGDGMDDFAVIAYACAQNNLVATIEIFDVNGQPIKTIVNNQALGTSEQFTWDGITDQGQRARVGYYLVLVEAFDTKGNTQTHKLKIVVGSH